ncbi:MAG TPA: Fur family transcriptional regulator [Candidatus Sulfomarinibacteraceae bacterium]|nr:Fur family transcriptional regulator [Candidatus Sulfomarinibacteraceae bacterium]
MFHAERRDGDMDEDSRQARLDLYQRLCHEHGMRCTVQRRIILEAALILGNHPTADQVLEEVRNRLPGIARPTVYRALEHLADLGVISKACHPGHVARYDTRTDLHHHLVCLQCNQFVDFTSPSLDGLEIPNTSGLGFEVSDYRVQLRGTCRSCRERVRKEGST